MVVWREVNFYDGHSSGETPPGRVVDIEDLTDMIVLLFGAFIG